MLPLINTLGTLPDKPKSTWRKQVPTLVHAYNCTRNNVPLVLVHATSCLDGNHVCQLTLLFGTKTADLKGNSITYIENLKKRIEWAYQTANEAK